MHACIFKWIVPRGSPLCIRHANKLSMMHASKEPVNLQKRWIQNRNCKLQIFKAPLEAKRMAPAYTRALRRVRGSKGLSSASPSLVASLLYFRGSRVIERSDRPTG